MLVQLHHQFSDNQTEFCSQRVCETESEVRKFSEDVRATHPLPLGAAWHLCNWKSENFLLTPGVCKVCGAFTDGEETICGDCNE